MLVSAGSLAVIEGAALEPPIAEHAADGSLNLLCKGVDTGKLYEASLNKACTRAGASMVIDFIFVGTVGGGSNLNGIRTTACDLMSPAEAMEFACPAFGVSNAVKKWGSDHLPVACDIDASGSKL